MKHLFLIFVMLSALGVVLLPFLAWHLADGRHWIGSVATAFVWIALLAYLLVRGAT